MVEANQVDIIGHLDYINRYYKHDYSDKALINEILYKITENNLILEVNTSAPRRTDGLYLSFPNIQKLEDYAKLNKYVTIGTDAHKLDELAYSLQENYEITKMLKLEPVIFSKRKMIKMESPTYF